MNAKATVTATMVYLVILVVVAQGWISKFGETVRRLTGTSATSKDNEVPTE